MRSDISSLLSEAMLLRLATYSTLAAVPLMCVGGAASDAAITITSLLFLLRSYRSKDWGWLNETWFRLLAALWLYMIVRGFFAEHIVDAARRSMTSLRFIFFPSAAAYWVMHSATTRRRLALLLAATVLFIVADAWFQWAVGQDILGHPRITDPQGHVRLTGPFTANKPIAGILVTWLCFPFCISLLFASGGMLKKGWTPLIGALLSLAILGAITLSGERMALLLALLGWTLTLILTRLNWRMLLLAVFAGGCVLGAMILVVPDVFDRQVKATITTFTHWEESPYGRIFASDLRLAVLHPVVGLGAGHFRTICPSLYPNASPDYLKEVCNIHPHNIYMEWLIEEGMIGLVLYVASVWAVLSLCLKQWPVMRGDPAFIGWLVAFLLRIWPIASSTGFFTNWGAPPYWFALAMVISHARPALAALPPSQKA